MQDDRGGRGPGQQLRENDRGRQSLRQADKTNPQTADQLIYSRRSPTLLLSLTL